MKTKKLLLSAALIAASITTFAQVGVGTTDPKAALDVVSTDSGFIMPRVADHNTLTVGVDQTGMQVYNTTTKKVMLYDGSAWVAGGAASKWTNDATNTRVALTNLSDGTTARTAGTEFVVTDTGNVGIGTTEPGQKLDVNGNIYAKNHKVFTYTKEVPTVVGNSIGIAYCVGANGGEFYEITVVVSSVGFNGVQKYLVPSNYEHNSSDWRELTPLSNTTNQFILDVKNSFGSKSFRLRRTFGSVAGSARVEIKRSYHSFYDYNSPNTYELFTTYTDIPNTFFGHSLSLNLNGNVGIGTTAPTAKLDVNGMIKVGTSAATPVAGMIKYETGHFYGYTGAAWVQLDN